MSAIRRGANGERLDETCKICGRPTADYGAFLKIHGAFRHPPFPSEGTCGRGNQAQDYYDNGECEDCATYPLKKRIAELESLLAKAERYRDEQNPPLDEDFMPIRQV